jgi:hypothetical protein
VSVHEVARNKKAVERNMTSFMKCLYFGVKIGRFPK